MNLSLNRWKWLIGIIFLFACRTPDFIQPELSDRSANTAVFLIRMNDVPAEDGVVEKLGGIFKEAGFTPVIPFFTASFFSSKKEETIFKSDSAAIRQLKIPTSIKWLVLAQFKHYAIENTSSNNSLFEMSCMVEIKLLDAQSGQTVKIWKYSESGFHTEFDLATQQALANLWALLRKKLVYELKIQFP